MLNKNMNSSNAQYMISIQNNNRWSTLPEENEHTKIKSYFITKYEHIYSQKCRQGKGLNEKQTNTTTLHARNTHKIQYYTE